MIESTMTKYLEDIWNKKIKAAGGKPVGGGFMPYNRSLLHKQAAVVLVNPADTEELIPKLAAPTFTPVASEFAEPIGVEIACTTEGAEIYYTTNGDTPDNGDTLYEEAIAVTDSTNFKAIAIKAGYRDSDVTTKAYTYTGE